MKDSKLGLEPPSHSLELSDEVEDRVRRRAYEIYEERAASGMASSAEADWLQAQAEILTHQVRRKAA